MTVTIAIFVAIGLRVIRADGLTSVLIAKPFSMLWRVTSYPASVFQESSELGVGETKKPGSGSAEGATSMPDPPMVKLPPAKTAGITPPVSAAPV